MQYKGTAGDDSFTGTSGNDVFYMGQGGHDTVSGGGGNDVFSFGAALDLNDKIDGGTGYDTLRLNGDYSSFTPITGAMLQNVERISVAAGHSYDLALFDGVIAKGKSLLIDGTTLGASDFLGVDGSYMSGASAGTTLIVNAGASSINFTASPGVNILHGGSGAVSVYVSGQFNASDRFEGGTYSNNSIFLTGDFSAGLKISGAMMHDFQELRVESGYNYKLATADACVGAGQTLNVGAPNLGAGNFLYFDGSLETDGKFSFTDGAGNDTLIGGAQHDYFDMEGGGVDRISGGGGDDSFGMGGNLTAADRIDGGAGNDELDLNGDYSAGLTFKATTMVNVETIYLNPGNSYKLIMNDGNVAAGQTLAIVGGNIGAAHTLYADASKETNGTYVLEGGDGNDRLIGGQAGNTFIGGLGQDHLTAGQGADVFTYNNGDPAASSSLGRDIITGFNALHDTFDMSQAVSGIDAGVNQGALSTGHFDTMLAQDLGANRLHAGDAVLFKPDSGNLAGHTFLVVDANGQAGYQAGADYVFQLEGATHLASLSAANFT